MVFVHQEDDYVIEKKRKVKTQKYALIGIWKATSKFGRLWCELVAMHCFI